MPNFCLSHKRVKVLVPHGDRAFAASRAAPDLKQTRRDPAQGPPEFRNEASDQPFERRATRKKRKSARHPGA